MTGPPLWQPGPERIKAAAITRFMDEASSLCDRPLGTYEALWEWSVADIENFWSLVWDFPGRAGSPRHG